MINVRRGKSGGSETTDCREITREKLSLDPELSLM